MRLAAFVFAVAVSSFVPFAANADQEDPYLWLEEVTGEQALAWVREKDAITENELAADPRYAPLRAELNRLFDAPDRIPTVQRMGQLYYNFWRDAAHPRGLWRRTTLAEYAKPEPKWETVIDLDALAKRENENWIWEGFNCLRPLKPAEPYLRCLISLSRGGADAVVVREFDLAAKTFVQGGFTLPEAKSSVDWMDIDTLWVGTDFGAGSMTDSGYPRIAKQWRRGTPLARARTVYEGKSSDVAVQATSERESGARRDWIERAVSFWQQEWYLLRGGRPVRLQIPLDAKPGWFKDQMYVYLRSAWKPGKKEFAAGSVLTINLESFLAGQREFTALYEPGPQRVFGSIATTRNALLLTEFDNVKSRLYTITRQGGEWKRERVPTPEHAQAAIATTYWAADDYMLTIENFTTPTTLLASHIGVLDAAAMRVLKRMPAVWKADGIVTQQFETTSRDGTKVPYFVVMRRETKLDGTLPTLLYGYGGFENAQLPWYSRAIGKGWMEPGGAFVLANVRGGGEFGPSWHQAALREHRQKSFDDFIAVAEDLTRRSITSPRHLGIIGGSNGGLLVAAAMTQRPELFGAVVSQVPLTDMLRFHKLLAGASWIDEYGNPEKEADREFLAKYSPYHNIKRDAKYPRLFLVTSTRDDRVHPAHARKLAARMLEQGHDVLYYENIEGGHGAAANNEQRARMWAQTFTFLWKTLKE